MKCFADNLIILQQYKEKCQKLRSKNKEKYILLQNLKFLNKRNHNTTKILQEMKKDHDNLKAELLRDFYKINLDVDKQKIVYKNKLNEYFITQKKIEAQLQKCRTFLELEDLVCRNNSLLEQYENECKLFDRTKKQYNFIKQEIEKLFTMKVCEFCKIILKLKVFKYKDN